MSRQPAGTIVTINFDNLKSACKRKGTTIQQLSRSIGYSDDYFGRRKRNFASTIRYGDLIAICHVLGCKKEAIIAGNKTTGINKKAQDEINNRLDNLERQLVEIKYVLGIME